MAQRVAVVKQDPDKPVEQEVLAEAIVRISTGLKKLTASGINRKGIVALLSDDTKLGKGVIETVIDSLDSLAKTYTR